MNYDRLRDLIKNQTTDISFEDYKLRYAGERFLMRLKQTPFKNSLILKGGFLMGILYKIDQRSTKDLDASIRELHADSENVKRMLQEIMAVDLNDGVSFVLVDLVDTQKQGSYGGFRAKMRMNFEGETYISFDLDLGIGDIVTPGPQIVEIPLLFNESKGKNEVLNLLSYPLETIFAEKTETILTLGTKNTRMKDFYDIHLIMGDPNKPSVERCYKAFINTWEFRHNKKVTDQSFEDWLWTIDELMANARKNDISWQKYVKDRSYAQSAEFIGILEAFKTYITELEEIFNRQSIEE